MATPSDYELGAWRDVQQFKRRPLSQGMKQLGDRAAEGIGIAGGRAATYLEKHPRAKTVVSRSQKAVGKGAGAVGSGARKAGDVMPDWGSVAFGSARRTVGRMSRIGLSPKRIVAIHRRRGHGVTKLSDIRRLDLEQIDAVGRRGADWYYPAVAALSGSGAAFVISGGELAVAASAGASAAPSMAAVAAAFAGDAAAVLALSSRSVGHISLLYGYDPEMLAEKLFVMSVVNAGTATTSTAKAAAMADISRLTQALVRDKTWAVLNESVVARVTNAFAAKFGTRLTKQGLGKVVPAAGVAIGGVFNWATLESIVDTADVAYRRRFLLEKYPQLADDEVSLAASSDDVPAAGAADEAISVLDELAEAGGPEIS